MPDHGKYSAKFPAAQERDERNELNVKKKKIKVLTENFY